MALSKAAFLRSTVTLLLVGLATLLVIVATTLGLAVKTAEYSDEVFRGRQLRSALVETRSFLQDAETGQRGYLLTHEDSYLQPYERGRTRVAERLARVTELLGSGPGGEQAARLRRVVAGKLAELAQTVDLARANRLSDALAIVRTDTGRDLMDEARGIFDELLRATDGRIGNRMNAQDRTIVALEWATVLGALVIVLVVGGSAYIASRYTRELVAAREELAALNQGLEQRVTERTAAVERANDEIQRFAYVVSHDLRSPLVNVMGFTSELESLRPEIFDPASGADRGQLAQDFDEALGFIRTSIGKMDGLIGAILKLARDGGRRLAPEAIDLRALVGAAADNLRHRLAEAGGTFGLGGGAATITSDRLALDQIVGNLLDNAVKYRDPGRPIAIKAEFRSAGDRVEIDVSDNGRGIQQADHERVFDLFRRAGTQDAPGEGIGLAHVRSLTRRLGGEIRLRSEPGQGTTFTVSLPRRLAVGAGDA